MIGTKPGPYEMTAKLGEGGIDLRTSLHADRRWNALLRKIGLPTG